MMGSWGLLRGLASQRSPVWVRLTRIEKKNTKLKWNQSGGLLVIIRDFLSCEWGTDLFVPLLQ